MSDARIQRDRLAALLARRAHAPGPGPDGVAILVETKADGTYPIVAAAAYAATPLRVGGSEVEGSSATFAPAEGSLVVVNVGSKVPPVGTKMVAHSAGGRWVARYDG